MLVPMPPVVVMGMIRAAFSHDRHDILNTMPIRMVPRLMATLLPLHP